MSKGTKPVRREEENSSELKNILESVQPSLYYSSIKKKSDATVESNLYSSRDITLMAACSWSISGCIFAVLAAFLAARAPIGSIAVLRDKVIATMDIQYGIPVEACTPSTTIIASSGGEEKANLKAVGAASATACA